MSWVDGAETTVLRVEDVDFADGVALLCDFEQDPAPKRSVAPTKHIPVNFHISPPKRLLFGSQELVALITTHK